MTPVLPTTHPSTSGLHTAQALISAELLHFPPSAKYVRHPELNLPCRLFEALGRSAPQSRIQISHTTQYQGRSDWLLLYGPGGLDRQAAMVGQRLRGGRTICWDAPYWQRGTKLRVSIDHAHPQAWVMRYDWPSGRYLQDHWGFHLESYWDQSGPIVVAGLGPKARVQYGAALIDAWEAGMIMGCRRRWPGRRILYRSKPPHHTGPPDVHRAAAGQIETILRGVSLVVTWHSNVAVDAIRHGIPVVCADGAAAAVCPATLPEEPRPLPTVVRDRFLANLAWFQWAPDEAAEAWHFLRTLLVP